MKSSAHLFAAVSALSLTLAACTPMTPPGAQAPQGRTLYGLTTTNALVRFGSDNADKSLTSRAITNLPAGEVLVGIDFEPGSASRAGGVLFALGASNRLYTIDLGTAAATAVGTSAFTPGLNGANFGVDFNPTVNRLRVHSDADQNVRLNQETGAVIDFNTTLDGVQTDLNLNYKAGDPNAGQDPAVVGTAYTNSVKGATTTTLFAIDANRDVLVTVAPPNDGVLTTVGSLGVNTNENVGFDITPDNSAAFATLTSGATSALYTINLTTGAATLRATLAVTLRGIAAAP